LRYCTLFESTLAAFVVGSAFLNRAHFDLLYHLVAVTLVFEILARREMADPAVERRGGRGVLELVRPRGFAAGTHRPTRGFRTADLVPGEG
jgi:hypothetical protein